MSQTVKGSLYESITNIVVGFTVNFAANMVILPPLGFHALTPRLNFGIGLLYTIISLVRSFVLRRIFTRIRSHHVAD
jgi:membrane-anchored protein YejM (alkaline phosphatase superfamily)